MVVSPELQKKFDEQNSDNAIKRVSQIFDMYEIPKDIRQKVFKILEWEKSVDILDERVIWIIGEESKKISWLWRKKIEEEINKLSEAA